jgi:poly(3-hydroxybutyrate) depolymerase
MKLSILFAATLVLLPLVAEAASKDIQKETFTSQGRSRTYSFYAPKTVKADAPAPLIVLLHGSGHDGLSLVEKWDKLARKEGIFLAGLDSTNSKQWSTGDDGVEVVYDLVEGLKSKYPIDARRVYLFGHSAGAVHSLILSLMESEYFAATAIHAGMLLPEARYLTMTAKRKIPMAIIVGTVDEYFPLTEVRETRETLSSRGFPVELTEMPGHNHWYYDLAPKINQMAWDFLSKHRLEAEPRFEPQESKKPKG